jgi:hypothetical protein
VPGDRWIRAIPCYVELYDHNTASADDRLALLNVYGNGSPSEITGSYDFHMSDSHYTMEIGLQQI